MKTGTGKNKPRHGLLGKIKNCDFVLLCLPDDQILPFWESIETFDKQGLHFSGSFFHKQILGFHPLMTFGLKLYPPDIYKKIPFVGVHELGLFQKIFPQLKNPYLKIKREEQNFYHSLCVLAGNGTVLLWDLVGRDFNRLGIKDHHFEPYLKRTFENIYDQSEGRWSGPWYRGDMGTVNKNRESLAQSPLRDLYEQFFKLSKKAGHFRG